MKSFIYGAIGALVSAIVITSMGTALVCLVIAAGTVAYFQLELPQAEPFQVQTTAAAPTKSKPGARKARTGQLVVQVGAAPIQLYLDGEPMVADTTAMAFVIDTSAGDHVVQVKNAWMKEVARHDVSIRSGKKTLLKYRNRDKSFSPIGTYDLAAATPAPAPAPAPVAVVAVAETPVLAAAAAPTPAPAAPQARRGLGALGGLAGALGDIQLSGDSSERRKSSSSSTQYGEVTTSGPTGSTRNGYVDTQSDEVETSRRRGFRLGRR